MYIKFRSDYISFSITAFVLFLSLISISVKADFHSDPDAILTKKSISCRIDNYKLRMKVQEEIMILNRNGEDYAEIGILYSVTNNIRKLEASLYDKYGNLIRKLKKSEIVRRSYINTISLYEDNYIAEFSLRHHDYPFTIKYSYEQDFNSFYNIVDEIPVLWLDIPTINAEVEIDYPADYRIKEFSKGFKEESTVESEGRIIRRWSSSYTGGVGKEFFSPPYRTLIPRLIVIPEEFYYDVPGRSDSWSSFGEWVSDLNAGMDILPPSEKNVVRNLVKDCANEREKMKKLYEYVQDNTRYINVSIETGGYKPYPAGYVVANRYGDCKALSNYYHSLLGEAGIESWYALVNAGDIIEEIIKEIPTSQFNHAIVCAVTEGDTIWIDCTSENPFGYAGTFIQGREALVISGNESGFRKIPPLMPSEVLCERYTNLDLSKHEQPTINMEMFFRGDEFEGLKDISKNWSHKNLDDYVKENIIPDGVKLDSFEIRSDGRDDRSIVVEFQGKIDNRIKKFGNDILVGILPLPVPDFERPSNRLNIVQINYPLYYSDSIMINGIDPEYFVSAPENIDITTRFGKYSRSIVISESGITISKFLLINRGIIERGDYHEFFSFIREIEKNENSTTLVYSIR